MAEQVFRIPTQAERDDILRSYGGLPPEKSGFIVETGKALANGALSAAQSVANTADKLDLPGGEAAHQAINDFAESHQNLNDYPGYSPTNLSDLPRTIGKGLGNAAGQVGIGIGAAAASGGNPLVVGGALLGANAAQMYGDTVDDMRKTMPVNTSPAQIEALATASTGLQSMIFSGLGPGAIAGRAASQIANGAIRDTTRKFGTRITLDALKGGGEAGSAMVMADLANNMVKYGAGSDIDLNADDLAKTFAAGAFPGMVMGGAGSMAKRMAVRNPDQTGALPDDAAKVAADQSDFIPPDAETPVATTETPDITARAPEAVPDAVASAGDNPAVTEPAAAVEPVNPPTPYNTKHFTAVETPDPDTVSDLRQTVAGMNGNPDRVQIVQPRSTAARTMAEATKELTGLEPVYFHSDDPINATLTGKNRLYVNADTTAEHPAIATGHEFGHYLERQYPDLYQTFRQAVIDHASENHSEMLNRIGKTYADRGIDLSEPARQSEFANDVLGERFVDPQFWRDLGNRLESQQTGLGHRLAQAVIRFVDTIKGKIKSLTGAGNYIKNLDKVRSAAVDMVAEYRKRKVDNSEVKSETAAEKVKPLEVMPQKAPVDRFEALTPQGNVKVSGRYRIADADQVMTSDHPAYNQAYQPRNRDTVSSRAQIEKMAAHINPSLLQESPLTDTGAPLVDRNGQVISGNGRTMALRKAYDTGKATDYVAAVHDFARQRGIEVPAEVKRPVLVREIAPDHDADLARIAELSNRDNKLQRTAAEQAEADAQELIKGNLLDHFNPGEDGEILTGGNNDFNRAFVRTVGDASLLNSDGSFSPAMEQRVRYAVLGALLHGEPESRQLLATLVEQRSVLGIKRQVDGVMSMSGQVLKLANDKPEYDIRHDLAQALRDYVDYRKAIMRGEVKTLDDYLSQGSLFDAPSSTAASDFILAQLDKASSMKQIREWLGDFVARGQRTDNQTSDLFGAEPPVKTQLLHDAAKEIDHGQEADLFQPERTVAANDAKSADAERKTTGGDVADATEHQEEVKTAPVRLDNIEAELRHIIESDVSAVSKNALMNRLAKKTGLDDKAIQEKIESTLVKMVREIDERPIDDDEKFREIVALYNRQPNLAKRTSTSVRNQAYSTPAPLAWMLGKSIDLEHGRHIYEPTAGNGMLVAIADPKKVHVNELNQDRLALLHEHDFGTITDHDATQFVPHESADRIIMNPPFGGVPATDYQGFRISKLEDLIAVKALEALTPDGRAAMILGANREAGKLSTADWVFMNYLYNNFNVADNFEVEGNLYRKQGAGFPVRVIVLNGRRTETGGTDDLAPKTVDRLDNWDIIYNRIKGIEHENLPASERTVLPSAGNSGDRGDLSPSAAEFERTDRRDTDRVATDHSAGTRSATAELPQGTNEQRLEPGQRAGNRTERQEQRISDSVNQSGNSDNSRRVVPPDQDVVSEPHRETSSTPDADGSNAAAESDRTGRRTVTAPVEVSDFHHRYQPQSKGATLDTVLPRYMAEPVENALSKLAEKHGSVDRFVAKELGYENADELHRGLAAEQIDSVALAIDNLQKHQGTIIGDQTGIGKGRQAAALIDYAKRNQMIPIFFTVDPKLFSDMYGDSRDIGRTINPFLVGDPDRCNIVDRNNTVIVKAFSTARQKEYFDQFLADPGQHDSVFITYSQLSQARQRQFIQDLVDRHQAMIVMDEAHNAAGDSITGLFFRGGTKKMGKDKPALVFPGILKNSQVVYLSATYAKRPDNMPLYFRTALANAVDDVDNLPEVVKQGGLPLQQIISKGLAEEGQYIRRERDFSGVKFDTLIHHPENYAQLEHNYDATADVLRGMVDFSNLVKKAVEESGKRARANTREKTSVEVMSFGSVAHNYIAQALLANKADLAVDRAMEAIHNGQKPLLALSNTMESALDNYVAAKGIKPGDVVDMKWNDLLLAAADRMLAMTETRPTGEKITSKIDPVTLGLGREYRQLQELIREIDTDSPISPLDYIEARLRKQGIRVAELTGRNSGVNYDGAMPTYYVRGKDAKDKNRIVNDFNAGKIDALLLNQSGSTGLSLHASEKFADQKPRRMIMIQPHLDINVVQQMFGRILRSGQVVQPSYELAATPLAAEKRPLMILNRKLKSLNANTTANTKSSIDLGVDFLNKYGDEVARDYLEENPELVHKLDLRLNGNDDGGLDGAEDLMRSLAGKLALLPNAEQERIYSELEQRYNDYVNYLKATGAYDLEIMQHDDWDVNELNQSELSKGNSRGHVFEQPVDLKQISIKKALTLPKMDDIRAEIKRNFGDDYDATLNRDLAPLHDEVDQIGKAWPGKDATFVNSRQMANINNINSFRFFFSRYLNRGMTLTFRDGEQYNGFVTGYVVAKNGNPKNPASASRFKIDVAIDGAGGKLKIPYSKILSGDISININDAAAAEFTGKASSVRENRYAITGNLVKGMEYADAGKVVTYKRADGNYETGILMPKIWQPGKLLRDPRKEFNNSTDAVKYLAAASRRPITTLDGDLTIENQGWRTVIVTPKSKRQGGGYYLDKKITDLTGDFESRGNLMVAQVDADTAAKVIKYLYKSGKRLKSIKDDDNSYSLQPGHDKTLKEAAEDKTIKPHDVINAPDGKNHWGGITPEMAKESKGKLEPGRIVMLKGEHFNEHNGYGARHIILQHEADFKRYGYDPDTYVHNVLRNPDEIWFQADRGNAGRYLLVKHGYPKGMGAIELRRIQGEDAYSVTSAFPEDPRLAKKINGVPVWKRGAKSNVAISDQSRPLNRSADQESSHLPLEEAGTQPNAVKDKNNPDSGNVKSDYSLREQRQVNPGDNPDTRAAHDDIMDDYEPGRRTRAELDRQAKDIIDRSGTSALIDRMASGDLKADTDLNIRLGRQLMNSKNWIERYRAKDLTAINAMMNYVEARTEAGRSLAAGQVKEYEAPEEFHRDTVKNMLLMPGKKYRDLQQQIAKARQNYNDSRSAEDKAKLDQLKDKAKKQFAGPEADTVNQLIKDIRKKYGVDPLNLTDQQAGNLKMVAAIMRDIAARKATLGDKIYEYWINSILSGPQTHAANTLGNIANATLDLGPTRFIEAIANKFIRNPEAATFGEFRQMNQAFRDHWKASFRNAAKAFDLEAPVTGGHLGLETKFENGDMRTAIGGKLGRVIRMPGRFLVAADELAKGIVGPIEAAAYAYRMAKADGLTGDKLAENMKEQLSNPQSAAVLHGRNRALELAFQNRPWPMLDRLIQLREANTPAGWVAKFLLPFIKTPGNIIATGIRKSPLGSLQLGTELIRNRGKFDTKSIHHLAEQVLAWGAVGALWSLSQPDDDGNSEPWITGTKPGFFDSGKGAFMARNLPSTSIRIGDTWYSYNRIEPLAEGLAMIVDGISAMQMAHSGADGKTISKTLFNSAVQNIRDKTFLNSIGDLVQSAEGGADMAKFSGNFVGSWVPNVWRQTVSGLDDVTRDNKSHLELGLQQWLDTFWISAGRGTGFSTPLPKLDLWGNEISKDAGSTLIPPTIWRIVSPVRANPVGMADADRLLWNYNRANPDTAYWPLPPQPYVRKDNANHYMSSDDYYRYAQQAGQDARAAVDNAIAAGQLNPANPDDHDIKTVKEIFRDARIRARQQVLGDYSHDNQ